MENMDQNECWLFSQKYSKCPRIYLPDLSAQAQKFWISIKKASFGVRSPWVITMLIINFDHPQKKFHNRADANMNILRVGNLYYFMFFRWIQLIIWFYFWQEKGVINAVRGFSSWFFLNSPHFHAVLGLPFKPQIGKIVVGIISYEVLSSTKKIVVLLKKFRLSYFCFSNQLNSPRC